MHSNSMKSTIKKDTQQINQFLFSQNSTFHEWLKNTLFETIKRSLLWIIRQSNRYCKSEEILEIFDKVTLNKLTLKQLLKKFLQKVDMKIYRWLNIKIQEEGEYKIVKIP